MKADLLNVVLVMVSEALVLLALLVANRSKQYDISAARWEKAAREYEAAGRRCYEEARALLRECEVRYGLRFVGLYPPKDDAPKN